MRIRVFEGCREPRTRHHLNFIANPVDESLRGVKLARRVSVQPRRETPRANSRRRSVGIIFPSALSDFPGVACVQEPGEIARALLGDDFLYWFVDYIFIARQVVPGAKDADGSGKAGA